MNRPILECLAVLHTYGIAAVYSAQRDAIRCVSTYWLESPNEVGGWKRIRELATIPAAMWAVEDFIMV